VVKKAVHRHKNRKIFHRKGKWWGCKENKKNIVAKFDFYTIDAYFVLKITKENLLLFGEKRRCNIMD
jgi:hypothetical protein